MISSYSVPLRMKAYCHWLNFGPWHRRTCQKVKDPSLLSKNAPEGVGANGNLTKEAELPETGQFEMTQAWLSLGSNLGDSQLAIRNSLDLLNKSSVIHVLRLSSLYVTKPWGFADQPDFLNAVAEITVSIDAVSLLNELKKIEQIMGRNHKERRWGPRIIDLDLLLFAEQILYRPGLTVPHPRMHRRRFVLEPLFELEPDLMIPSRGTVRNCLQRLNDAAIQESEIQLHQIRNGVA
jgi:2-amino-4-hydroxy-6-hydroxymethyldihydropteridine diphosphokinase